MTSPTDGDCRCAWGRDEDGLPECQDGDCRCPQHCVDGDTGLVEADERYCEIIARRLAQGVLL